MASDMSPHSNLLLKKQHRHASVRLEVISRGVGRVLRNLWPLHERDGANEPREDQIVYDFGSFAIDLRVDFVNERAVAVREIDTDIVRRRAYPDRLSVECPGSAENAQVMTLRKGIIALLKCYVGRAAVQQQDRHRPFFVAASLDQSPGRLELRLRVQLRGDRPSCLRECR